MYVLNLHLVSLNHVDFQDTSLYQLNISQMVAISSNFHFFCFATLIIALISLLLILSGLIKNCKCLYLHLYKKYFRVVAPGFEGRTPQAAQVHLCPAGRLLRSPQRQTHTGVPPRGINPHSVYAIVSGQLLSGPLTLSWGIWLHVTLQGKLPGGNPSEFIWVINRVQAAEPIRFSSRERRERTWPSRRRTQEILLIGVTNFKLSSRTQGRGKIPINNSNIRKAKQNKLAKSFVIS